MGKKGQVTLFVIIALVIISLSIAVYFLIPKNKITSFSVENLEMYVMDCLEKESKIVIDDIANRGGYYLTPKLANFEEIPFYIDSGENYFPEKDFIANEMGEYLSERIFFCTKNFKDFQSDYDIIKQDQIKTTVFIYKKSIEFEVEYPIKITKGESSVILKNFNTNVKTKFGLIYETINEFLKSSNQSTCLDCLLEISLKNNLYVDIFDGSEGETIFIFKDKDNNPENEEVLRYVFATKD